VQALQEFYGNVHQNAALVRVWFPSGWHSTTLGLAMAENSQLAEYLPEIIYVFNLNLIQNQEKLLRRAERNRRRVEQQLHLLKRTPRPQDYLRSRRLLAQNRRPFALVGWLQVSLQPFPSIKSKLYSKESQMVASATDSSFQEKLAQLKEKLKG